MLIKMLKNRSCKDYLGTCLIPSAEDTDLDRIAFSSERFIVTSIRDILADKLMIQDWFQKTSTPTSLYIPVLLRLVVLLYLVTLTYLGDCYEVTSFLKKFRVFDDLPVEFSAKIVHALRMRRSRKCSNFTRIFADALATVGNHMVVLGSPKGRPFCRDINATIITYENLRDVNKVMELLCPEEPSVVKLEYPLPEMNSDSNQTCNAISVNFLAAHVHDNMETRRELRLSDENIPFWEKFESFQVYMHGSVS
jgi:hypothetical protein